MNMRLNFLTRLRLPHKFALLGAIGLITVGVPLYGAFQEKLAAIEFAQTELNGMAPIVSTLQTIKLIQDHRGAAGYVLIGQSKNEADMAKAAGATDAALAKVEALLPADAGSRVRTKWAEIKTRWNAIKQDAAARRVDQRRSTADHGEVIAQMLDLIGELTAQYKLDLDPTPQSNYMIQSALVELPRLSELIGQLRGPVVSRLIEIERRRAEPVKAGGVPDFSSALNAADRARFASSVSNMEYTAQRLKTINERLIAASPGTSVATQPMLDKVERDIQAAADLVRREILNKDVPTIPASVYLTEFSKPRESVRAIATSPELLEKNLKQRIADERRALVMLTAQTIALLALGTLAAWFVIRSVTRPMGQLIGAVRRLEAGDDSARARLAGGDEVAELGVAFDRMMDVRVARLTAENEKLNSSVIGLLQAVAQLARKDLTVKVPVTEDVTGPVADALNLLSSETAKVLQNVSDISADVTQASLRVKEQATVVQSVADSERRQIEQTAESLERASQTMGKIAELAQACNATADRSIKTTQKALETVTSTVGGINSTRETIRETEKRIKRLGERSQEISVAVNLINTIAERTHILALNAAMHAASAGEAGRGFAVVADEVQRLAENARQATQQIATLVNNIQVETADTVNTMNTAISQVVEGSKLAEQAGLQMQVTQQTTAELVSSVQRIAAHSQEQARTSREIAASAIAIRESTLKTSREMIAQTEQTNRLVEYARNLIASVRVFKLSAT